MLSNNSRSISPVGIGLGLLGGTGDVALPPKSRGMGGRTLPLFATPGEGDPGGNISRSVVGDTGVKPFIMEGCISGEAATTVWLEETLKKDEEPLLAVVIRVAPEGRPVFSFSFSLSIDGSRSLPLSRFIPKESLEAFLTIEGRLGTGVTVDVSPEVEDVCWPCPWPLIVGSMEERSIEGR